MRLAGIPVTYSSLSDLPNLFANKPRGMDRVAAQCQAAAVLAIHDVLRHRYDAILKDAQHGITATEPLGTDDGDVDFPCKYYTDATGSAYEQGTLRRALDMWAGRLEKHIEQLCYDTHSERLQQRLEEKNITVKQKYLAAMPKPNLNDLSEQHAKLYNETWCLNDYFASVSMTGKLTIKVRERIREGVT